jgi:hypothetical protein
MLNFRPKMETLELRENPAAPLDVHVTAALVEHNAEVMSYIVEHPGYASNTDLQPLGLTVATVVIQQSQTDTLVLNQYLAALQTQIAADPNLASTLQPMVDRATDLVVQAGNNMLTAQVLANYIITVNPQLAPPPPPVANFGTPTGSDTETSTDGNNSSSDPTLIDSSTLFNADGTVNQDAVTQSLQNNGNMPASSS